MNEAMVKEMFNLSNANSVPVGVGRAAAGGGARGGRERDAGETNAEARIKQLESENATLLKVWV